MRATSEDGRVSGASLHEQYRVRPAAGGGAAAHQTRRAVLGATVLGATATAALAACGGPATVPATGAKPAGQTLKDQKLTFLHWWTDGLGPGYNAMMDWSAKEFNKRTGANVELVDGKTGGGLNEKFITMASAGAPPDASFMSIVVGRDNYDAGMLKNLSPYVAKTPDIGDKEFFDSSKKFRTKNNETFGIPTMGPESLGFLVNSGLLGAVGLDPKGADFKTWDDFTKGLQKLAKVNGEDFQPAGTLVPNLSLEWLQAWLYSNGSQLTTTDDTKYQLDVPATREAAQYSVDLIHKYRVSPKLDGTRPPNARQALIAGQVAVIYDESAIGLLNAPSDFKFSFIPLPKGPRGTGPASATWTNFASVAAQSKNPDGAVEWIRWFTSVDAHIGRMVAKGGLPGAAPRVKLYDTPEWKKWVQDNPILAYIPEAAKLPGTYPYLRYRSLSTDVSPIFKEIMLGTLAVNQGLADAQRKADDIMSKPVVAQ